jgi:hypothetical protein
MKVQASLEFILITSAIAVLSLSVISLYGKNLAVQRTLLGAISNATPQNYNQLPKANDTDNPQIAVYAPVNSTSYGSSNLQITAYGCTYGTVNLTLTSPSVFFANNEYSVKMFEVAVLSIPFEPLLQGPNAIDVRYDLSCGNATESGSESLSTYARPSSGGFSTPAYSAYISNRSEEVRYALEPPSQVINLTEWSHCTDSNFWGTIYPISEQCGASAWGYMAFSGYCYYTKAVSATSMQCIAPVATGYNTSGIRGSANYTYGFSLAVSSPFGVMRAKISGPGPSNLTLDNETVGSASVASVGFSGQPPDVTLITSGNGYSVANSTALAQYLQAKNNLYGTLGYYNSTSVDDPTQSSIQQTISTFISASEFLRASEPGAAACVVSDGAYVCEPISPLTYVIDVNVSRNLLGENQTLYYLGSEINLFRG